jgi:hypothetical protein
MDVAVAVFEAGVTLKACHDYNSYNSGRKKERRVLAQALAARSLARTAALAVSKTSAWTCSLAQCCP